MKGIEISKERQECLITCYSLDVGLHKQTVPGYKVTFAGYEEFDFFLHWTDGLWKVSEAISGKSVCGSKAKSKAVIASYATIRKFSPAELKAKIAEELKLND